MLKIRLQRVGRKNIPTFRVVLTDSRNSTKSGKFLEVLGSYDPVNDVKEVKVDRVKHWISVGAQTTGTVHNFLVSEKIVEGKKVNVLPRKKPIKPEEKEEKKAEGAALPSETKNETPASETKTEEPAKA